MKLWRDSEKELNGLVVLKLSKYEWIFVILFLLTAPVVKPWVEGDGTGYYAFARCLLIQHNFDQRIDWLHNYGKDPRRLTNPNFFQGYLTSTGHLENHYTIGPAILWSPFLVTAQRLTVLYDKWTGSHLSGDGYSKPYMVAIAAGALCYAFLALWISFRLARKYVAERWAFLATFGIWMASSLTWYIYAEPSFAHVPTAFTVALFVWYWDRTRNGRTWTQWLTLGAIGGLMLDTYYPTALIVLLPGLDALRAWWSAFRNKEPRSFATLFLQHIAFLLSMAVIFFPTLIVKKIFYGSYLSSGYETVVWQWSSPAFWGVCFSSRGMFGWTPVLLFSVIGLVLLHKADRILSASLFLIFIAFTYFIGCYEFWHGIPSFGNRYLTTLTVLFVVGLAAFLEWLGRRWGERRATVPAIAMIGLLILWNVGLMFQCAAQVLSHSYPISLRVAAYNQVVVVPRMAAEMFKETNGNILGLLHKNNKERAGNAELPKWTRERQ